MGVKTLEVLVPPSSIAMKGFDIEFNSLRKTRKGGSACILNFRTQLAAADNIFYPLDIEMNYMISLKFREP